MRAPLIGVPLLVLAAILAGSCNDEAPFEPEFRPPATGAMRLITSTTGADLDPDGYDLAIETVGDRRIGANDTLVIGNLLPRTYRLSLSGAAANCSLARTGLDVPIVAGDTFDVVVAGTCMAMGTITVTVETTGVDFDPNGYLVTGSVPGFPLRITTGTSQTVPARVLWGRYSLTLVDVAANCDVTGANPVDVEVASGGTADAAFRVGCAPVTRLAYTVHNRVIQTIASNGTAAISLGDGVTATDRDPAWSPDGLRLAFTSLSNGNIDVFVMDADGSNRVRLTTHLAADQNPTWSPDGARIAFVSERDGNAEIYVMRADGSEQVRLSSRADAADVDPAWSPDGTRIAFSSDRDGNAEIYVMDADGSAPVRLTTNAATDLRPAWSPQGDRIAFERWCSTGECVPGIIVMGATGAAPTPLTSGAEPAWSPDGRKIAYTSYVCSWYYYYTYNLIYGCEPSSIRAIGVDGRGDVDVMGAPATTPAWRW
jgi:hypothetical protein